MNRKRGAIIAICLILLVAGLILLGGGNILWPTTLMGNSTATVSTTSSAAVAVTTLNSNPQSGTTTTTTGIGSLGTTAGLQQALAGNSGLSNFISARECGLTGLGVILFCDTFPDNSLDSSKWVTAGGNITVTPGQVQFNNATMRSKMGFYYGHFAEFNVNINLQPNGRICPVGFVLYTSYIDVNGASCSMTDKAYDKTGTCHAYTRCVWDYSVWGFGRAQNAESVAWGVYWEQNGTEIRSHTRYTDFRTNTVLDEVSAWAATPTGNVTFGINWNLDAHGAYAQFIYQQQGQDAVYFSKHTTAIPKTFLYLFAASNGTYFTLYRVIILPAWSNGIPVIAGEVKEWF